jgi:hypothetical protein
VFFFSTFLAWLPEFFFKSWRTQNREKHGTTRTVSWRHTIKHYNIAWWWRVRPVCAMIHNIIHGCVILCNYHDSQKMCARYSLLCFGIIVTFGWKATYLLTIVNCLSCTTSVDICDKYYACSRTVHNERRKRNTEVCMEW